MLTRIYVSKTSAHFKLQVLWNVL